MFSKLNSSKYDLSEYVGDTKNYIIASTPRCGSTFLGRILRDGQIAGSPHEYFHDKHAQDYIDRWGTRTIEQYVEMLKKWRASSNGVFGIKLHYHQLQNFELDSNCLDKLLPNSKYIFIRRKDKENQAISLCKAERTDQWTLDGGQKAMTAVYDFDRTLYHHRRLITEENDWLDYFKKNNIHPLTIWYKDLSTDYIEVLERIYKYLEIDYGPENFPEMPTRKMANLQTWVWKSRYKLQLYLKWINVAGTEVRLWQTYE